MAYNLLRPLTLLSAVSMSTDITSVAVEIKNQDNIGVQLNWTTADAIGAFSIQISSDHVQDLEGNIQTPGNWISLPLSPGISSAGNSDTAYVDLNQMSAQYMRVLYTRTSGSGTVTAIVVAKGV